MTRLLVLPNQGIIDGFKGTIDFYVHRGIPCARKWPRKTTIPQTEGEKAGQIPFSYAAKEWVNLTPIVQRSYNELAVNSGLTGRDMQVRAYMTGLYRYPIP